MKCFKISSHLLVSSHVIPQLYEIDIILICPLSLSEGNGKIRTWTQIYLGSELVPLKTTPHHFSGVCRINLWAKILFIVFLKQWSYRSLCAYTNTLSLTCKTFPQLLGSQSSFGLHLYQWWALLLWYLISASLYL